MTAVAYRPEVDGLRAVAVMAVVLNHLHAPLLPGGFVGVDVFFVISGYLITRIILTEAQAGRFSFVDFYARRARRIFPALFAMLAASLGVGWLIMLPSDYAMVLRGTLATLLFSSNVLFYANRQDYFGALDEKFNPLLHTWSLSVEEQFYLLFPLLLLACLRLGRHATRYVAIGCAVLSLALAQGYVDSNPSGAFYLAPFRAWELTVGALLAMGRLPVIRSRVGRELLMAGGLGAIVAACAFYGHSTTFPGLAALAPVGGAALILYAGASGPSVGGWLLQQRAVVYVGLISYSLYLWHWPVIVFAGYLNDMLPLPAPVLVLVLGASLALAALSYRFIEQPWRRGPLARRQVAGPVWAAFTVVMVGTAVAGLMQDGFTHRFDPEIVRLDRLRQDDHPYVECSERWPEQACVLGQADVAPTLALWGDSHMLSWAPALHESLQRQGKSALLLAATGCAPLIQVRNAHKFSCAEYNERVQQVVQQQPQLRAVVISGFWRRYFHDQGPLSLQAEGQSLSGTQAAQRALILTLDWLHGIGRTPLVIGPVPVYERSIPVALALAGASERQALRSTQDEQRRTHASFFDTLRRDEHERPVAWLDPLNWLCSDRCELMRDGKSLYRDSHHLSHDGALMLVPQLEAGLQALWQVGSAGNTLAPPDAGAAQANPAVVPTRAVGQAPTGG